MDKPDHVSNGDVRGPDARDAEWPSSPFYGCQSPKSWNSCQRNSTTEPNRRYLGGSGWTGAPGPIFCRLPLMIWSLSEMPLFTTTKLVIGSSECYQLLFSLVAVSDDINVLAELA